MTAHTVTPPSADAALVAFHIVGVLFAIAVLVAIGWLVVNSRRPQRNDRPRVPADVDLAHALATTKAIDQAQIEVDMQIALMELAERAARRQHGAR